MVPESAPALGCPVTRARFEKTRMQAGGTIPCRARYPGEFAVKLLKQADLGQLQRLPLFQICAMCEIYESPTLIDILRIFHHRASA